MPPPLCHRLYVPRLFFPESIVFRLQKPQESLNVSAMPNHSKVTLTAEPILEEEKEDEERAEN